MYLALKASPRAARFCRGILTSLVLFAAMRMLPQPAAAQSPVIISYTNATAIGFPAEDGYGPWSAYPSDITVTNFYGTLQKVTVSLAGVTSDEPPDMEIAVGGPASAGVVVDLMYNAGFNGGSSAISGVNLTFDDAAAGPPPLTGLLTSGTYQPNGTDAGDNPAQTTNELAGFLGAAPAGTWSLYVFDTGSYSPDPASISSWSLNLTYLPGVIQFSNAEINSQGLFQATLSGLQGFPLVIEGSTNFVNWTFLETNAMASSSVEYTNTNPQPDYLFYRAVLLSSLPDTGIFSSPQFNGQGQFQMTITGQVGIPLVIDSSPDFKTWTPIATNPMVASPIVFTDTNAPVSGLFYRTHTIP